uniref:Uncharacterized protein n=1 Tax=Arundo donax TaxID=35708 RepID=A0A0A9H242_ARUDO
MASLAPLLPSLASRSPSSPLAPHDSDWSMVGCSRRWKPDVSSSCASSSFGSRIMGPQPILA